MRSSHFRSLLLCTVGLVLGLVGIAVLHAAIPLSTTIPSAQNFDGMGIPANSSVSSTLPPDFRVDTAVTARALPGSFASASTTVPRVGGANVSSTAANGVYNFGAGITSLGNTDRAVGFLSSGTATGTGDLYAQYVNNTGATLAGLQISYDVEKYRLGTNAAGFCIQLYYSSTGAPVSWTSAGANFLTTFPGDPTAGGNAGFATVPGAVQSVTNQALPVSIPNGGSLYLAWNYSVCSGTTTTNGQALAIDNINVIGFTGGTSTNPSVNGSANPSPVDPGASTLLTAIATGPNPISTVTVDLSPIGGSKSQAMTLVSGSQYSFAATVAPGTSGGAKTLTVTATDTLGATGTGNISLTVNSSTPPTGVGAASPSSVLAGQSTQLTVTVTPGAHPASTGLAVTVDLSSIGGSATQAFTGNGNTFTFQSTVDPATAAGGKSLPVSITDAQNRSGSATIALTVTSPGPSVQGTTPANGAGGVLVGSHVAVTFNEPVNASGTAFAIQCPTGTFQVFSQSASPATTITLTPNAPLPGNTTCTVTITGSQIADTLTPSTAMTSDVTFSFATAPAAAGQILINEIDADTPGSDTAEFIELKGPASTPLDGLVVVLYDGGAAAPFNGKQSYASFDLTGYSTDANGYFVLGNPGVPNVQLTFDPGQFGLLQNGPDAVALYIGHGSDFPVGTNVTTTNLLDAIVYGTDDPAPVNLMPLITSPLIVNEDANGNGPNESSQRCPDGMGGVRTSTAYLQALPTPGAPNACPSQAAPSSIVISQVYGGGGNNATSLFHNDFVELYNRGTSPVDIARWSLQYASATGSGWSGNLQPLGGIINPGEYYLISLASGGSNGAALPAPNVSSSINISVSSGKLALSDTLDPLVGNCPLGNPHVRDFVGYGTTADCGEGASLAPTPSTTQSDLRQGAGSVDTNSNQNDFTGGTPTPRRTAAIVTIPPYVFFTDPLPAATSVPRDATIEVAFTVPVDLADGWFDISCAASGQHNEATVAVPAGTPTAHYITPNVNFQAGEQCTATILKSAVQQTGSPTDTLPSDYVWSFTVAAGAAPPETPAVHLLMGNPTGAAADTSVTGNFLMSKPEFALSYNRDLGRPNWVSWHLTQAWIPANHPSRVDTFRADPQVPPDWYRVESFDFSGSGFDRGHMSPNADRESSLPVNQATFLMSNMIAQAPANNQGPWADFENYLRTVVNGENDPSQPNEIYIVSGSVGRGGAGSNGAAETVANGHVVVPSFTWKVALVLPDDGAEDDVSRVTCSTRTIAVIMPNDQTTQGVAWQTYLTTVAAVEQLVRTDTVGGFSQFTVFSNVPAPIQYCIKNGTNGVGNPRNPQTISVTPVPGHAFGDADFAVDAAASSNLAVALTVDAGPAQIVNGLVHLTGIGTVTLRASQAGDDTYLPATDVVFSFGVGKGAQTIVFGALPGHTYGDAPFTVSATGGGSGNAVTFVASGACASSGATGATITIITAGGCTVVASQAGSATYDAAPDASQSFTVARATPAFSGVSSPSIEAGTGTASVTGVIGVTGLVPSGSVGVTLGATTLQAAINPSTGAFTATFTTTAALSPAGSPYAIALAYVGDARFASAAAASTLTVADTTPPTIALVGAATITVEGGTTFVDPGATASDSFAGNLTPAIHVTGAVNTFVVGPYTLTYTVSDGYNTATTTRTVNVVDTIPPVITLVGGASVTTPLGSPWTDPGATALDSRAGDLTSQIVRTGTVNTAAIGTYTVTYTVSDGVNTAAATRIVHVADQAAPVISHLAVTPNTLFFPTNTLWPVLVTYDTTDNSGAAACSLSVTSNDDDLIDHGKKKGQPDPDVDFVVVGPHLVLLRAEKEPKKDPSLVYTITVTCSDASHNTSTAQIGVTVRKR
jgi:endonuclease G